MSVDSEHACLFQSPVIRIGRFELAPSLDRFHQHGFVEEPLVVFPRNPIWIEHQGKEAFVADNSRVNFYNSDQVYRRSLIDPAGDLCYTFQLRRDLLEEICFEAGFKHGRFEFPHLKRSRQTFTIQLRLLGLLESENPDRYALEELTLELISSSLSVRSAKPAKPTSVRNRSRHMRMIESVKSTILEDLSASQSLRDISQQHHVSEFHLSRLFKRYCGQGLSQFRNQARLRSAAFAATRGENLSFVACDHGFANHSHLTASFRQYFGCTPRQFKEQIFH